MPKILLVEDEAMLREAFTIVLSANSYDVDAVINGREALERIAKTRYDLILLDLMMPVLDGVGFLEQARLMETSPETRVVVLSNMSSGDVVSRALSSGAHRHEVKSNLSPKELLEVVREEV